MKPKKNEEGEFVLGKIYQLSFTCTGPLTAFKFFINTPRNRNEIIVNTFFFEILSIADQSLNQWDKTLHL